MMGNRECESSVAGLLERHFEVAFSAPEGVKKLRELILTLAMKGKLVPQDPNDQPASELLKEIEVEKQRLVKEGKIKPPKALPPISPDDVPYALPSGWEWARLGDIVLSITGGGTPSKNNPSFWSGSIPWASVKDLNVDLYLDQTVDSITEIALEKSSTNLIPKGRIIVCTRMGLGKIAINRVDLAINQDLKALDISTYVDAMFFVNKYKNYRILGSGMTVHGIRQEELLSFLFPLPPLAEQHRIVARIDELMARCDALEMLRAEREEKRIAVHTAAMKQLLDTQDAEASAKGWQFISRNFGELYAVRENVAELRKAILQLAVMGKLVPQDPNDPPASELLQEIEAEKQRLVKAGIIKKQKPLPPINPDEVPYDLPKGWEWVMLGEIVKSMDYGTSQKTCDDQSLIPVYRMGNISSGRIVDEGFKYISPDVEDLPRLYLNRNDILFNRTNSYELVGKSALYNGPDDYATFASYLIRISLLESRTNPEYISMVMNAPYFRSSQIEPEIVQQCGQANFNGTKLSLCLIPLPPHPEQHRIVARVNELMSLCDTLESQLNAKKEKQTELLYSIMV